MKSNGVCPLGIHYMRIWLDSSALMGGNRRSVSGFLQEIHTFSGFPCFFLIFQFPQLFIVFLGFSGFPQLPKGLFRFLQIQNCVFWFPLYFPIFPGFRDLKMAFSGFRHRCFFRFSAEFFGIFWFSVTFSRPFRLSAKSITAPLHWMVKQVSVI